jgi:tRNA-dihydrouridine synthase
MRLGWDHASLNAPELAARAEAEGVALVTVHGRTRQQFYKGKADWAAIRAVRERIAIPLVANGDCASPADAEEMLRQSGADAVMIGRCAVGRPWLVGDIAHFLARGVSRRPLAPEARLGAALEHYETLLSAFGVAQGLRHARKHLAAYAEHASVASGRALDAGLRHRLVTSDNPGEVRALLADFFLPDAMEAA